MIKQPDEIALLAESGRLLASVFTMLDHIPLMGLSTRHINDMVERFIVDDLHSRPASKGQYGFEYVLNSSINQVVCHGVPSHTDILRDGDIVNLDITLEKGGYIADSSKTYLIGNVAPSAKLLVQTTYDAMWKGIQTVRPGSYTGDIGAAIEKHATQHGYSVVREYYGHGIGREMHEEPQILHFGDAGTGVRLREGMVFTIEPMINRGKRGIKQLNDGWTVVTKDNLLSAQFEHTVAVTSTGVSVLTLRPDEQHMVPSILGA